MWGVAPEHAGIYGQYVLGALAELSLALAAPSLFTVYGRPPRLAGVLVVGVSQSGQSPDIVAVVEEGRRPSALRPRRPRRRSTFAQ